MGLTASSDEKLLPAYGVTDSPLFEIEQPDQTTAAAIKFNETPISILEQSDIEHPWPDVGEIKFNEGALYGGTLPATPDSRVRAVVRGAKEASEKWQSDNPNDVLAKLDPMTVNTTLRQLHVHFKQQRKVGNKADSIEHYVNFGEIKAERLKLLEKNNHPLYQAMNQVRLDNARRQVIAASNSKGPNVLSKVELEQLEDNLLKFAFIDEIKIFCAMRIKELRLASR